MSDEPVTRVERCPFCGGERVDVRATVGVEFRGRTHYEWTTEHRCPESDAAKAGMVRL